MCLICSSKINCKYYVCSNAQVNSPEASESRSLCEEERREDIMKKWQVEDLSYEWIILKESRRDRGGKGQVWSGGRSLPGTPSSSCWLSSHRADRKAEELTSDTTRRKIINRWLSSSAPLIRTDSRPNGESRGGVGNQTSVLCNETIRCQRRSWEMIKQKKCSSLYKKHLFKFNNQNNDSWE